MKTIFFHGLMFFVSNAFAEGGPTSYGPLSIGMSRSEFIAVAGTDPVICKSAKEPNVDFISCENSPYGMKKTWLGTAKHSVGDVQWELMEFIDKPLGRVTLMFYKERLIRVKQFISLGEEGNVVETLTSKYGLPKTSDNTKIKKCQNKGGAHFENAVGDFDLYWTNGRVKSVFRTRNYGPIKTCTDPPILSYYILEEPDSVKVIENALESLEKEKKRKAILQSPF
jgi:hypothetical protein